MTVAELCDELAKHPQNAIIVMSRDGEGNGYSPLHSLWLGAYEAGCPYSGDVGLLELTDEDRRDGYDEEDLLANGVAAVILTPTN